MDQPSLGLSREELTAAQLAQRMGTTVDEVLRREKEGRLFSDVRERRPDTPLFPIYQLAPEIAELALFLRQQFTWDSASTHLFFCARDPDLADLSVRELLCGQAPATRNAHPDAQHLLQLSVGERRQAALCAAARCDSVLRNS